MSRGAKKRAAAREKKQAHCIHWRTTENIVGTDLDAFVVLVKTTCDLCAADLGTRRRSL